MRTSERGLELIKGFESPHDGNLKKPGLQPKMDPIGIWSVGYGHALLDTDGTYLKGLEAYAKVEELYPDLLNLSLEQSSSLLVTDLMEFERHIDSLSLNLKQYEFDSLVSFSYNLGFGSLKKSTLLKRIQSRTGDIREAFLMWNKAGGKVMAGLTRRRNAEATLFLTGELQFN